MSNEPAPVKAFLGSHSDYVRLHITPLDPELVRTIIPATLQPITRNISFHTIHTFPEKRYGFVELPQMDADKLKKKLNGSLLKGSKIRIEDARPEKQTGPTSSMDWPETKQKQMNDSFDISKKQKRDHNTLEGVILKDRKVKRGWTEPLDTTRKKSKKSKDQYEKKSEKRKQQRSKYTDQAECLLRVKMPPNAIENQSHDGSGKKSQKGSKMRAATVHEFEKTTKFPGFLRHAMPGATASTTEFVEGKGWVDEDGNVVEAVKKKALIALAPCQETITRPKRAREFEDESDDSTSCSGTSEEGPKTDSEAEEPVRRKHRQQFTLPVEHESVAAEERGVSAAQHASLSSADGIGETRRLSFTNLAIKVPLSMNLATRAVHPLEALYKRPKLDAHAENSQEQAETFTFFGRGCDDEENEEENGNEEEGRRIDKPMGEAAPMTPFTQRDFEWRKMRSAAPTPDTAHVSRKRTLWNSSARDHDSNDSDVEMCHCATEKTSYEDAPLQDAPSQDQNGFQTWFWTNRSDLIRSWKSRRKAALKEKRHRENKARAFNAI